MTEQEWLTSSDPNAMLRWYSAYDNPHPSSVGHSHPPISDRKLRLFVAACCRQVWQHINGDTREAVLVAERYADGQATSRDRGLAFNATDNLRGFSRSWASAVLRSDAEGGAYEAIANACDVGLGIPFGVTASLLRDIIGNPYRPVLRTSTELYQVQGVNVAWRFGITPLVVSLAQAAYAERPGRACVHCKGTGKEMASPEAYDDPPAHPITCRWGCANGRIEDGLLDPVRLAVLADALEEAGCPTDACEDCGGLRTRAEHTLCVACGGWIKPHPLLAHLRSPGPHVRGCYAVDLCLGRS